MSEDGIYKQEFHLRYLATRTVTLYPSRAYVIRDINDIDLKPGANEITIIGLTPTADENSIKCDGRGQATITDMTVDLIPNPEIYENVYPSESEDSDDSETEDEDDSEAEDEAIRKIDKELEHLAELGSRESERTNSANSELKYLENFAGSLGSPRPASIKASLDDYRQERARIYDDYRASLARGKEVSSATSKKQRERNRLSRASEKAKKEAYKVKAKDLEKKRRARVEESKAKARLREERIKFWPRKVFRVILSLDVNSGFTPSSSRRGSINSAAKSGVPSSPDPDTPGPLSVTETLTSSSRIALSLSYITYAALWWPRYDLSLTTPSSSGTIIYRAEFCNTTSETWRDAKIILSTSQTSYQGLGEPIPTLLPWHISLTRGQNIDDDAGAFHSHAELRQKQSGHGNTVVQSQEPRTHLFGLDNSSAGAPRIQLASKAARKSALDVPQHSGFGNMQASSLFGSSNATTNITNFGQPQVQQLQMPQQPKQLYYARQAHGEDLIDYSDEEPRLGPFDGSRVDPTVSFEESEWAETGLTASYPVPGTRTLPPSDQTRRHKIATIALSHISLSYIIVPKLRPAAFLKARLRNPSSTSLLKGLAGLTLDSSFLGNVTLPRCEAGETIGLPLGVDPGVHVAYLKPTVRKSTSGVFSKEEARVYARTCIVTNTKSGLAVECTVLDQVPVSEDEKLKVDIVNPKGLKGEGDTAKTGEVERIASERESVRSSVYSVEGAKGTQGKEEKWGRAAATMKKGGEVNWAVKLNPGAGVRLLLEYEVRFPGNEKIVGV